MACFLNCNWIGRISFIRQILANKIADTSFHTCSAHITSVPSAADQQHFRLLVLNVKTKQTCFLWYVELWLVDILKCKSVNVTATCALFWKHLIQCQIWAAFWQLLQGKLIMQKNVLSTQALEKKASFYIAMMSGFGYFYFSLFCIVQ